MLCHAGHGQASSRFNFRDGLRAEGGQRPPAPSRLPLLAAPGPVPCLLLRTDSLQLPGGQSAAALCSSWHVGLSGRSREEGWVWEAPPGAGLPGGTVAGSPRSWNPPAASPACS